MKQNKSKELGEGRKKSLTYSLKTVGIIFTHVGYEGYAFYYPVGQKLSKLVQKMSLGYTLYVGYFVTN